jgi:polysaccharide biosynthesis protein PelA
MGKLLKQAIAALFCLAGCAPTMRPAGEVKQWAVYYDQVLPASAFKGYDLVVFDRRHYPKFDKIKRKTRVLAYVSIGEVYANVPEKEELANENALLFRNSKWNSHAVDMTSPLWRTLVLSYVDDAVNKGFDGVMLDTIDSPLHWAQTQAPERLDAMIEATASLVRAMRDRHPSLKIMVNRGFDVLPLIASDIDYVLAESTLTQPDETSGQFAFFSPQTIREVAAQLHRTVAFAPQLQVLTLDYWNMDDVNGLERIYALQRAQGFAPYVTTPDLITHTPEPTRRTQN